MLKLNGSLVNAHWFSKVHYWGRVVPKDYKQAAHWFSKAAEQGDAGAQTTLKAIMNSGIKL
ncbi:hypothetical protein [uncultured Desulfobacter sp.]|uniref:hypothetical protein n=1 Tax=uncultured Desulfobacter sp. TaxID=240139 RepID=UPI003748F54F